ncbi:MAG: AAA family ATPase [Myxococcales bacterium]|nr:AAA family ATPase [Myxococcales bacterium]
MKVLGWEGAEERRTHVSRVLLGPERVLKIKRAVDLGFLDFTTLQARRRACEAEVWLDERTGPGVALGVRELTEHPDGLEVDGSGRVVDVAVEMRRLPDDRRMEDLMASGRLTEEHVDEVARWLAAFHDRCEVSNQHGGADVVGRLVRENFAQLPMADDLVGPLAQRSRTHLEQVLASGALQRRREAGRVRDGHGDLRLDHVYLLGDLEAPRVVAIDGLEFSAGYRCMDVAAEVAFLALGLRLHGCEAWAERLVARWALHTDDWGVYDVIDFYVGYRAWVRAKVAALRGDLPGAALRLEVAGEVADERDEAVVVVVCGPIAAGKSTVARELSSSLAAPVLAADPLRKRLAGVAATEALGTEPFAGAYSEQATMRVYQGLMERAAHVLRSGRSVVLDASFRTPALCDLARKLADDAGVPCRFVVCRAPEEVLRARLRARGAGHDSDAREPLLDAFLERYHWPSEPEPRATPSRHDSLGSSPSAAGPPDVMELDTTASPSLEAVSAWLSEAVRDSQRLKRGGAGGRTGGGVRAGDS